MTKIPVGVLGATGRVGQTYVKLLENHPLFELTYLSGSPRCDHLSYEQAIQGKTSSNFNEKTCKHVLAPIGNPEEAFAHCRILFSALGNSEAKEYEENYAAAGIAVFSSASIFRNRLDIPMIIPEINPTHLNLIKIQRRKRGWKSGCLVVKPNCTLQSFLLPLFPLHQKYRLRNVMLTTMQSISGAGSSFELENNVIPFIIGEEEKSEQEPFKILGVLESDRIIPAAGIAISVHCNRVPVLEGHLACVSASFQDPPQKNDILSLWADFKGEPQKLGLPFAPKKPLHYLEECDRPQPQLDLDVERGMSVAIGRLRTCSIFDVRFTALSHNLIRGAAGGGILTAELALKKGLIHG